MRTTVQLRELFVLYRARKVSFAIFIANFLSVVLCGRILNLLMVIHIFLDLVTRSTLIPVSCQRAASVILSLLSSVGTFHGVAEKLVTSHGNRGKLQVIWDKLCNL